ncbi:MAG: formyltransferase family protein [Candidatus Methanosuratincola sp.]|jgi:phosphoribosylglycinamide formyltransferase-1
MRVAVLISGSGSNMLALLAEQRRLEAERCPHRGSIECVFTNVPHCTGAERARELGLCVVSLSSKRFFDILGREPDNEELRDYYDAAAFSLIEAVTEPDLIVLAGYRRRLGETVMKRYKNRILNLYPGDTLKPYLIRGVDACVQALRAGEASIKATVFLAMQGERFGPVIAQSHPISLEGFKESDADAMGRKIREEGEHVLLPYVVHTLIARGRVAVDSKGQIYIDGVRMPKEGLQLK